MKRVANSLVDAHPTLLAGYIELIRALAMSRDWSQVAEAAQNASLIQNECIPVQLYECVEALVIKGDIEHAETIMSELYDCVSKSEPTNYELCLWIGRFLSAIMLDNVLVLQFAKFVL
jgi:hypothetical protein